MLDELANPQLGARALTSALMKACMVLVIRAFMATAGPRTLLLESLPDMRFAKAIDAVLDAPAADHTLLTMAQAAGMSRSSFGTGFSKAFDMSPMEFVARTRLYHAAQMLRSTPLPVKTIAGTVGFCSRSHFSRAFKAAYGEDPTAFRSKHANGATDPPAPLHGSRSDFGLALEG
jgi:transcriptional regulator GlxA family with amidase domain